MTQSPSEAEVPEEAPPEEEVPPEEETLSPEEEHARQVAEAIGSEEWEVQHRTVKVRVPPERWVDSITTARHQLGLVFLSWLSAIDWSNEVEVGDAPEEEVEERFEVLCRLSDLEEGRGVTFSTELPRETPSLDSLVEVFPGADWHERECHEMFGIEFRGHPNLIKLYLPDDFEGHPLRKSFPLLTREVKPWPGKVDVEDMPEEEEERQRAEWGEAEG